VPSLRIGGDNFQLLVCHFSTNMDISWWEIVQLRKFQLLLSCVTESKFTDDAVLYASSCNRLEEVASSFVV